MSTKIVTGKVRFSYVKVFEPDAMEPGQTKKYSMAVLIDKNDKYTMDLINAAVKEALDAKRPQWEKNGKLPKIKTCLCDGDDDKPDHEEYKGMMYINAKSVRKPVVVTKNNQPIMDQSEIYSGCYGRVQLSFYGYDVSGSKGIACGLEMIQTYNEGEPFAGGSGNADEVFGMEALEGAGEDCGF